MAAKYMFLALANRNDVAKDNIQNNILHRKSTSEKN
jgi:hypothetical protein